MLSRLRLLAALFAGFAALNAAAAPSGIAAGPNPTSGVGVYCNPFGGACKVWVSHGGSGGNGSGSGTPGATNVSQSSCRAPSGAPVACYAPSMGWYSQALHCYFLLVAPWPAPDDPRLAGTGAYHQPGDGAYYLTHCAGGAPTQPNVGYMWRADKPPGYGWRLSPGCAGGAGGADAGVARAGHPVVADLVGAADRGVADVGVD